MAEAAVTFLLENVQKLLVEQADLISGAEKELNDLQDELGLLKAFLMDYEETRKKGQVFTQFERHIREAVYEAEDILDACLTHKAKYGGCIFNLKHLDLAKKAKELRPQLQSIFDRAIRLREELLPPIADPSAATLGTSDDDKFKKTQLLRADNVVGFADEEATLIKYLNEKTEQLDVISIVGMPGLGKTTLAWKIYRDPKIQFEFPTLIWVYVSQELNEREVFLTILKKFTRDDMSGREEWELTRLVRYHLDKGRFLLFMDDVWTVEDWRRIDAALPKNNKLGKVLITSHHVGVATQTNRSREPHKLRFLTFEESWELLQLEVFGKNNTCPKELEGLGMHIARQCGGVPLAVVVIGGTLVEKCGDRRDWEKISDSVSSYVQEDRRTENIISLSYNKLPHHLRDCFLYLGMFPEDTEISAWKLTRLWIAEGFIQQRRGRSLEEVAEDNLDDLVARNLVMVERARANGDVKTCRVHDMIREFCQNEASFAHKNLFQEVRKTRHGVFDPAITEIVKRRRLCIHSNVPEFLRKKPKGPGVRSFVCFSKEAIPLPPEHTPSIPDAFDLLRVVDATPLKFTKFPPKLTKLIHLRYIALSGNEFKALPEAVSKLWNLQTVKIDTASREFEIKVDISKMMQLRHLKTKAAIKLKEVRGGGGENLQTLSRLMAECCKEELFNRASNLKNLGIRGDLNALVDATYLGKLERLEKLKLVHDVFPSTADKALHRVPHAHGFPPNLRMLTLSCTYLGWPHMAALGRLLNLQVLKLKEMAFKGTLWQAQGGGFPELETLHIERTELEIWTAAAAEPFPKLKNLILKNCERLQEIPCVVGEGKSLQLVDIERVSPTLVQSAKKIEEEKQQRQGGDVRGRRGGFKLKISPGDASSSSNTN
ncbi:putative late blight resistance protein homolog R1A-10 isoform X1 [Salvia miltiorrhiza]|uniref:putative late blight resistance protein homolog R1A-10 isoform X1 n=1 Tax=Salvia miltiorrhiza TaxID=226208 RepID=UPI0025AB64DC|nr:putative late blight resistance protein homolog R1A-10 isoform X1 [Salvia miltiorrhiza]XP_057767425.1 putative late blight resistance protein homolog R1A-10 isoform X1 [Salvia miltiorrhiza]